MPGSFFSLPHAQPRSGYFIPQVAALFLAFTSALLAQQPPAQQPTNPTPATKSATEKSAQGRT
jgi:hypothetical protein